MECSLISGESDFLAPSELTFTPGFFFSCGSTRFISRPVFDKISTNVQVVAWVFLQLSLLWFINFIRDNNVNEEEAKYFTDQTHVLLDGNALWSITAKNTDRSTGPLARPFARSRAPLTRSLAPDCSLRSRPPLRSLVCSLAHFAHSLARGKVNF